MKVYSFSALPAYNFACFYVKKNCDPYDMKWLELLAHLLCKDTHNTKLLLVEDSIQKKMKYLT